jgi:hypothetical protein
MTPLNPILHAVTTEGGGAASSTPTDQRPLAPLTAIGAGIEARSAPSLVGRVVPETELSGEAFELLEDVRRYGWALQSGSEELKNNFVIVHAAVQTYGNALAYASEELKNNFDIVFAAVKQCGWALEHASKELRLTLARISTGLTIMALSLPS